MYAIHRTKSRIPLVTAPRKWIASTLTIGSGGSAGAEGPIVTIGATIGSNIGRWLHTNPQNTATLLGCGAAAGIASVFNAPLAGIFFVMEVLLRDFSLRTFTPIVIAAVISAAWTQTMLGSNEPLFGVAPDFFAMEDQFTLYEVPNFIMLGVLCGVMAPLFMKALFWTDGWFGRLRLHPVAKPALGGAVLGLIGLGTVLLLPEQKVPWFYGNGYPVIKEFLSPGFYFEDSQALSLRPLGLVMLLLVTVTALKAVATCLTIGSGGSGGMFAPSLLMGSGVGGAFGTMVVAAHWFDSASPAHYALVGMAAMVAALIHAPLTGILIVYEVTRSYEIMLPIMLAAVISTVVARLIVRDSVYTWRLTRLGVRLGVMSDLTILRRLTVADVPLLPPVSVHPEESAQRLLDLSEEHAVSDFIVVNGARHYVGMVTGGDLRTALLEREAIPLLLIAELQRTDLPTVTADETLDVVLDKFSRYEVHSLAVLERDNGVPTGLITRDRLMRTYQRALAEE
jgi:CIC family chloride channel protein